MFDRDLAEIHKVETRALVQAVKRNAERFPEGFMFQLSAGETKGMSIRVVRVFIQLLEMLARNKEPAIRIEKLESGHRQHASALSTIVDEIRCDHTL
jgi:hypothetical protein